MRIYTLADGASPRLATPSPLRAISEISETGERVAVLVPGSCADQVAAALNAAYKNGQDDLIAAMAAIGSPLLIDDMPAEDVETIVRTAAELWNQYGSTVDPDDILSGRQKELLAKAEKAWLADGLRDELTGEAQPGPGQAEDNFVYVMRCGHEIDLAAELVPVPGKIISLTCSVHGLQQVSLAVDCDGKPLFTGDLVLMPGMRTSAGSRAPWTVLEVRGRQGLTAVLAGQRTTVAPGVVRKIGSAA